MMHDMMMLAVCGTCMSVWVFAYVCEVSFLELSDVVCVSDQRH